MRKKIIEIGVIAVLSFAVFLNCGEKRQLRQTVYPKGQLQEEYCVKRDSLGNYVKDGLYTWWYENGKKKQEGFFRNGMQHGTGTAWYETGEKEYDISAKYGRLDGVCTSWFMNGKKKEEATYRDGELISTIKWDEDGKVIE